MKTFSDSASARTKAIIIQAVIIVGLIAWFKIFYPRIERAQAAARAAQQESRIESFFESTVIEETNREVPAANGARQAHPQRLRSTPSINEVEQYLGAPGGITSDFRQGTHLTWTGTNHQLEVSFNHGRLYCLRLEDLRTGHGSLVCEWSAQWQAF